MTRNQIEYWNYVENSRHNKATESEQTRANKAKEFENNRANVANEEIQRYRNALTRQSNIINADYNSRYLAETNRSNLERERYNARMADISAANINLGYAQAANAYDIAQLNYGVGMANVGATYANIAEQSRANQARELETNRSNLVNEAVKFKTAGTDMFKAQTGRQQLEFDINKWNNPVERAQRQANYFHTIAQTNESQARLGNLNSSTSLNKAKTFTTYTQGVKNIVDLTSNAAKVIVNGIGAVAGGK